MARKSAQFKIALPAALAASLLLSACAAGTAPAENDTAVDEAAIVEEIRQMLPESILEKNTISVVTDPSQAPYEFVDDDDNIVGINPDLAAEVAAVLGVKLEWARADFGGLITGVTTKRYDMMSEAMWDTEQRQEQIDFVDNLVSANNIVVAEGNPEGIKDLPDLCGKDVSTLEGSMMVELFEEYQPKCGGNPINVLIAPTTADQLLWLSTGRAVATIANPIVTEFGLEQGSARGIEVVPGEGYLRNNYGWGFHKDNTELRDAVAAAIQHLIETGVYDEVMDKWKVSDNSRLDQVEINSEPVK
ncbi:ABC transporter substrate-binding protein [Leucobacter sp. UT-8R-CII-1-4]|uniref:ABC transporter substrate-binding protein n=1 Tax=Leucobacter sp. UT-8R-CII-1-4 TaxID=3040075 RepID=UPI0024A84E49|nr:ABC transporter substrate-binding protein [Leucobacter sp. UT-8R-CII-1-4]MDI6022372.1 ABC transporter substrate-binding protein [Leucobacter sp. UT-8R-CII-1-4]